MERGKEDFESMRRYVLGRKEILLKAKEGSMSEEIKERWLREFERHFGVEYGGKDRLLCLHSFAIITDLTPHLIASHYFFQGEASYRTDPERLLKVART